MLWTTGWQLAGFCYGDCQLLTVSYLCIIFQQCCSPGYNGPHYVLVCSLTGFGDGKYVSFEDRQWHQPCFKCSRCSVSLVGSGFFPDRGQILCTDCNSDDWPARAPAASASPAPGATNTADTSRKKKLWNLSLAHEHCNITRSFTQSQRRADISVFTKLPSAFSTLKCF